MDDFGNELHWLDQVRGFRAMGLYGWYAGEGMMGLLGAIDFSELGD